MRIALLSPYSWTYPGGVTRHIKALTECYMAEGHFVRVLAPYDPPGRFSALLHRGARPPVVPAPDYLIPLGRTIGIPANGSVSNVSVTPFGLATALTEIRTGHYDILHIHEAMSPLAPWVVTDLLSLPKVGTFHTYNENPVTNRLASLIGARRMLNRLAPPDRRLRGVGVDGPALPGRPLPDHPQRRVGGFRARPARGHSADGGEAEDPVRGPGR